MFNLYLSSLCGYILRLQPINVGYSSRAWGLNIAKIIIDFKGEMDKDS